jgi:glycosyltransferase involved in cell wall biosynthesis
LKILILTQYFPPEFGAAAARNSEHARHWTEAGHDVEVCTGMPNYPDGVIREEYRGALYRREERDGYVVHRSWLYATPNREVWKRALASLSFMVSALVTGLFKCRRPDVVIASSGPFFVAPLGYLLSRFKRARFVFEVRDILPQQAVDVGMLTNKPLIRLLRSIEEFLYRRADAVVTVAGASRKAIVARGFDEEKVHTIENGVDPEFFTPREKENAVRAEYGWEDKFVAMYIGIHGVSQGLYTLLEAAERLKDLEHIRFVFVGDGAEKPGMGDWAEQHGLKNVAFLPIQERDRMPLFYAAADACFVPLRKGDYFRLNIPSKLLEIMACGRPVILGAEGQALDILTAAGGGVAVTPEDPDSYAAAVRQLSEAPEFATNLGAGGRTYVVEHFSREKKAADYAALLDALLR